MLGVGLACAMLGYGLACAMLGYGYGLPGTGYQVRVSRYELAGTGTGYQVRVSRYGYGLPGAILGQAFGHSAVITPAPLIT